MIITAMQVGIRPTGVSPAQLYIPRVAPAQTFDITTLLTSITPLIMLIMLMQLIRPMMSGIA
jgi:hypothetical protein